MYAAGFFRSHFVLSRGVIYTSEYLQAEFGYCVCTWSSQGGGELCSALIQSRSEHGLSMVCIPWLIPGSRDSLLVRAPDSWSKGCEFESWQKWWENFLFQSQLCVLTLIRCPFHPCVTAVARKRPQSFCQKFRWQVTVKHPYNLDPSKLEWADYFPTEEIPLGQYSCKK